MRKFRERRLGDGEYSLGMEGGSDEAVVENCIWWIRGRSEEEFQTEGLD